MNCKQVQNQFDDRLDGRLEARQQGAFDTHLVDCAACRAQWQQAAALWQALAQQPAIEPSVGFATRTLRRLNKSAEPVALPVWRLPLVRWASLASLAAVVVVAGTLSVRVRREQEVRATQRAEVYLVAHQDLLEDFDVIAALDQLNGPSEQKL